VYFPPFVLDKQDTHYRVWSYTHDNMMGYSDVVNAIFVYSLVTHVNVPMAKVFFLFQLQSSFLLKCTSICVKVTRELHFSRSKKKVHHSIKTGSDHVVCATCKYSVYHTVCTTIFGVDYKNHIRNKKNSHFVDGYGIVPVLYHIVRNGFQGCQVDVCHSSHRGQYTSIHTCAIIR
jgi:hypothetical protein